MESLFKTAQPASLVIGGIPNVKEEKVEYALHIPKLLSFLAHGDFNAEVEGLDKTSKENWPPVAIVHYAFQLMVFIADGSHLTVWNSKAPDRTIDLLVYALIVGILLILPAFAYLFKVFKFEVNGNNKNSQSL